MTHTPGPWTAVDFAIEADSPDTPGYTDVVAVVRFNYDEDEPTARANARLIAAAPELLAALKVALNYLSGGAQLWAEEQIEAAIAKAEGREP